VKIEVGVLLIGVDASMVVIDIDQGDQKGEQYPSRIRRGELMR
jgi:hypothetical protein